MTMRRHVLPAFTKAALDSWQAMIDELAAKLVGEVLDNPGCDVVQRLAIPMPMLLIAHMLGIPDGDIDDFRRWSTAAVQMAEVDISRRGLTRLTSSIGGIRDIYRYFRQQFAVGGLKGTDTLLGKLLSVNASGSIDDDELFFFAMLLLIAGNETTTNLLGGMFDIFARHPEKFDMVRADHSLIPKAVEEQLRFSSPVQMLYRTTRTELRGRSRDHSGRGPGCSCPSVRPIATRRCSTTPTNSVWIETRPNTSPSDSAHIYAWGHNSRGWRPRRYFASS